VVRGVLHRPSDSRDEDQPGTLGLFARGFVALLPLWAGAVPVGVAFGVAARGAGLSAAETQLMSAVVFSAAAQVSVVALLADGSSAPVLIANAMAVNAQLLLLGVAVGRQLRLSWPARAVTAWFLTDGAYGVTAARGRLRLPTLLGAGLSMFVVWNAATGLGAFAGQALPDLRPLGIELVAPLTFLAVLVPLVRTRATVSVALVAAATALLLGSLAPGGVAVLGGGIAGSAAGVWRTRRDRSSSAAATPRAVEGDER